ncbi:MAG: DUF1772 domain-containing protein [Rhodospirillaceae bacterium]|nr:DUF1772 domain-containing protein [Rhodospirillaceae bacterium]
MSAHVTFILTLLAALGSGLMAGVFFAFSSFVVRALGRLRPPAGIAAMQSINIVVINPLFLGVFLGTGAVCIALLVVALMRWGDPAAIWLVAGSVLYVAGTIVVTMSFNVPLNEKLATLDPEGAAGAELWTHYRSRWTAWNHVRTVAPLAALACFVLSLR